MAKSIGTAKDLRKKEVNSFPSKPVGKNQVDELATKSEPMLDELEPEAAAKKLFELAREVEEIIAELEKSRTVTHETLKLVVSI